MKNPIFDIDNWKEITATLSRNKTRTFLTAFGIFWGTAMLAMLWGGAQGLQDVLRRQFSGFATNTALVHSNPITMPYRGYSKGMWWTVTQSDVNNIRKSVSGIDALTPIATRSTNAAFGSKTVSSRIQGVSSEYPKINEPIIYGGRFINEADEYNDRKVCVIGKRIADELFRGDDPVGKFISMDNIYYRVVGVAGQKSELNINGRLDDMVVVPISMMRRAYNLGNNIDFMLFTAKQGVRPSDLQPKIERILRAAHPIHPDDTQAIRFMDISKEFEMVDNMFTGVDILVLFVGLGSLMAGIIGVGNIMWIIVKERTQEIGIRRAIGAKPRDIIMQILSESVVLTIVAGTAGICFAVLILSAVAHGSADETGEMARFQLTFMNAIYILILFLSLGTAAGIIPAIKAMRIKPIEALNDK